MVRAKSARTGAEVLPRSAYRGQNLVCSRCEKPVKFCFGLIYEPHFKHRVANPDCIDSISSEYESNGEGTTSAGLRFVLRRTWDDDANRGHYARAVVGNPWSLALRVPPLRFSRGHVDDTFRIRVGEEKIETRHIGEIAQRRDVPIRPYGGKYEIVAVDGSRHAYRDLLRLPPVRLRPRGTFFRVTRNGISVATERLRWSHSYDFVVSDHFDAAAVPSAFDIAELPTDRTLSVYRNWSCYRIRLPNEPSAGADRWFFNSFQLVPQNPDVELSVVWPHSLDENTLGARQLPLTREILIAATRKAPGPAYVHVLVGNSNSEAASVAAIPAAIDNTTMFRIDLPEEQDGLQICYGWHEKEAARHWWPVEYLEVAALPAASIDLTTFGFRRAGDANVELLHFPCAELVRRLIEVRSGGAQLAAIVLPRGAKGNLRTRRVGTASWDVQVSLSDPEALGATLVSVLRDSALDMLLAINGFGSVYLCGHEREATRGVSQAKVPWLRHAVFLEGPDSDARLSLRCGQRKALVAIARIRSDSQYAANARTLLSRMNTAPGATKP